MNYSALVFTPLVLAGFLQPRNINKHNVINNNYASVFKQIRPSFVNIVRRDNSKQHYSNNPQNSDSIYNYTNYVKKPEKYKPDEILFNFSRQDLKATLNMYKDGANPDFQFKDGDTMAHLVAFKPLGPDQKSNIKNDNFEIIKQLGRNGHDFSIKNDKGQTSIDVAKERGNDELVALIEKIKEQQMQPSRKISEINTRLNSIVTQRNPSVRARQIAANLLKAGANVDESIPGSKNTIMDEAVSNWNKASSDSFHKLSESAKDNALKSTENIVYLGQNTSNKEMLEEISNSWEKDVKDFCDLGKSQNTGRGI